MSSGTLSRFFPRPGTFRGIFRYISLKGQCHEIFCFWFFSWIIFPQASDNSIKDTCRWHRWQICHRYRRHVSKACYWQHIHLFSAVYIYLQHFPTDRPVLKILVNKKCIFSNYPTYAQKSEVLCELIFATLCAAPHDMQILRGSGGQWLPYDALSCECANCCSYCQMTEDIVPVTYSPQYNNAQYRTVLMVGSIDISSIYCKVLHVTGSLLKLILTYTLYFYCKIGTIWYL
jgi:hypothetical protein